MATQYMADSDNAAWREIEGEVVLMRLRDGAVFSLEETGAFIWGLLEREPRAEEEIVVKVREEFGVDEETARADISEFLSEMQEAGLIRAVGNS